MLRRAPPRRVERGLPSGRRSLRAPARRSSTRRRSRAQGAVADRRATVRHDAARSTSSVASEAGAGRARAVWRVEGEGARGELGERPRARAREAPETSVVAGRRRRAPRPGRREAAAPSRSSRSAALAGRPSMTSRSTTRRRRADFLSSAGETSSMRRPHRRRARATKPSPRRLLEGRRGARPSGRGPAARRREARALRAASSMVDDLLGPSGGDGRPQMDSADGRCARTAGADSRGPR